MKCIKTLSNKKQCQAYAQKSTDYCFRHDPKHVNVAREASRKGGQNRILKGVYGKQVRLRTPSDITRFLGEVINAVWSEGVPVPVGSSMGFLSRCWLDAYEASDVNKRLEEIEEKVDSYFKSQK